MRESIRTFAILIVALPLAAGCSRAGRSTRVSSAPPDGGTTASQSLASTADATTIPGHPPVTTTGVVAKFDPTNGILIFQDGRTVKVTEQSRILEAKAKQPLDPASIRPGHRVIVQNALPVAVRSASRAGKRQRMATVASVNQQKQTVQMTDGSVVQITPSTNMHKGMEGAAIVLTDLRPGDELVIIMTDTVPASSAATAGSAPTSGTQPSALPSPRVITGAPSDPSDASELLVFREAEAP